VTDVVDSHLDQRIDLRSLDAYKRILGADDTLILSTDSDLLRFLKRQE